MICMNSDLKKVDGREFSEFWLHLLYNCNLSCNHCLFSCSSEREGESVLTFGECRDYTNAALALGIDSVYLTGGEPLMWPDLEDFVTWYYEQNRVVPLTILTNGTLIDRGKANFFSQYSSRGLNIRVSLECYTESTHDQYRGDRSFQGAVKGIKHLNSNGIFPWIAFVNKSGGDLETGSASELEQNFRERLKHDFEAQIAGLKIIAAYSKGRFRGRVEHQICPEQLSCRLNSVQCNYTLAASKEGIYPCPILVDVPEAKMAEQLAEAAAKDLFLNYASCNSCFATGTSCG